MKRRQRFKFARRSVRPLSLRARRLGYQQLEPRRLLAAQPVITEFMASNASSLEDAYGESPDWIELRNAGDMAVDLLGYHLTDDPADLNKWTFPTSTMLAPGEFLVVFASARGLPDPLGNHHTNFQLESNGEYVALTAPDQTVLSEYGVNSVDYPQQATDVSYGSAGQVLVSGDSVAEYLVPTDGSLGESWTSNSFVAIDNGFSLGRAAIGYENTPGQATSYTNLIQTEVPSGTTNVYLRTHFQVDNPASATDLVLTLQYDDGAVVYLNGTRVLSLNDPIPIDYNTPAAAGHADNLAIEGEAFDLGAYLNLLVDGDNTLAIHALNTAGSSDFLIVPTLTSQSITGGSVSVGYMLSPTPGGPNALTGPLGPLVSDVTAASITATAGQPLKITADIASFTSPLMIGSPRLHYRIMYGGEVSLVMLDNGSGPDQVAGDGVFTAQIPGAALVAGQMVRWYVTASDSLTVETRSPRFLDQLDSPEYYGTIVNDSTITTDLQVMHWFLANEAAASTNAGTRVSLFVDGEFYDNVRVDSHGQSTRGSDFPKKSFDFDANSANKFQIWDGNDRVSDFNLLTNYADQTKLRNTLTYDLFAQADHGHHLAHPVMVYRNGGFYGLFDLVEEGDSEYLERLGIDPENPLYKVNNRLDSAFTNVEKKSREYEDHSDFQEVVTAVTTLTGDAATTWDFDNLDIAALINYLAIHNVAQSHDFGHKNMYWVRDTTGTGLWSALPWDQDLSLGHQWDSSISPPYFKDALITNLNIFIGGNVLFQRLYADPTFRSMYLARVRSLADQFYGPIGLPSTESYLGQHIVGLESQIADEAVLDMNVWGIQANFTHTPAQGAQQLLDEFIPLRRSYINNHPQVPPSQPANPTIEFDDVDYDADPISGQQLEEYLRLNNPNAFAVDISGWRLKGGIDYRFKGGTVLPAGGSLYVVKDVTAFKNRATGAGGGQKLFIQGNYSGQLTYSGETVELVDAAGGMVDALTTPASAPSMIQQFLRVTEIHYNPIAADAEFIEFANISSGGVATTLDLSGVTITDGPSSPFVFAAGTMLEPGARRLVVGDAAAMLAAFPTLDPLLIAGTFLGSLSNGGERIKVVGAGGETIVDLTYTDGDPWPISPDGNGASLELADPSGTPIDRLDKPYSWSGSSLREGTPGAARVAPPPIRINEILAHTDDPDLDSIELYNTSELDVDISGWFLSDSGSAPLKFQIPGGTVIPGGGFLVFDEGDFNPTPTSPGPHDFALSGSSGETVWLSIANPSATAVMTLVDQVEFGATFNRVSLGRLSDGSGRLVPLDALSLGAANGPHQTSPLVVSELNYHPSAPSSAALAIDPTITESDLEFIELVNHSSATIDLTNWRIRGTSDIDLPSETIAAGDVLVVVPFDPAGVANTNRVAAFRTHYGIDGTVRLVGPISPSMDNRYGIVKLQQPDEAPVDEPTVTPRVLVDEVFYDDLVPWPEVADGAGPSLHRVRPSALGNDASSWRSDTPSPGTTRFVPLVESITINGGDATRSAITSLEVTFDSEVIVSTSSVVLTNTTTGTAVTSLSIETDSDGGKTTATITFNSGASIIERAVGLNTLDNGVYILTILGAEVVAAVGEAAMESDETFGDAGVDRFFRKYGDHNGDDSVSLLDFASLRRTFGLAVGDSEYHDDLDSDGDGVISLLDFSKFRRGFGT